VGLDARAEELLRAIARDPDDNAPRLAFAAHIEAAAPAHAALIVAQCSGNNDPELVEAFRAELPEPLREHVELDELEVPEAFGPVRGFVERERWAFDEPDLLAIDPDVLFRIAPSCTVIHVRDVTDFDAVGARIRRFDSLAFYRTHIDSAAARRLAAARGLGHLREIELDTTWIDDEALFELYQALPALERLKLEEREASKPLLLDVVRRTACARNIRELEISGSVDRRVLDLRGFSALRNLRASYVALDAGFATLPNRFHAVDLGQCDLTGGLRAELHESRVFSKLRELTLLGNDAQAETVVLLLASPHCGPLRSISLSEWGDLGSPKTSRTNQVYLAQALGNVASSLEQLTTYGWMEDAAQQALGPIPFTRLAWLDMSEPLTPGAAHALAAAPWIRGLRELAFDISLLDEASARALAKAINPSCVITPRGESEEEVFDAFGIASEEVPSDVPV
jgi:uncharacterized protein (TIGR02996 family)